MEKLGSLRQEIDAADEALTRAFVERMHVSEKIAEAKEEAGLPVSDPEREREKIARILESVPEDTRSYAKALYYTLFDLSKAKQEEHQASESPLTAEIDRAIENTPKLFPTGGMIACQGVEGAYSQIACDRMFETPEIMYFGTFENVFSAVANGLCRYGILPLENSTAGSVNKVYDLMMKYNTRIVKSIRLKVDHALVALPGATLSGIKTIVSHEQALNQCSEFLKSLDGVEIRCTDNTAMAAEEVKRSGRTDIAALASGSCAALYGLTTVASSVQDRGNNYTRFICISKELEIYPGADKTSIMLTLPHKPGALCKVLSRLYYLGINILKLESRPLPDRDFEFMFYFDLEVSVYSDKYRHFLSEIASLCEDFRYLGSYSETV